ncbi:MAG: hypothetical protein KatS3mg102_0345 [Planctomycetota bacterium]|nr:MAG: hypothetical protein KatS3mg102_0345 [Planctomycetota bacterium]
MISRRASWTGAQRGFWLNALRAAECEARLTHKADKNRKKQLEQKKREHERAKNNARRCYMERTVQRPLALPQGLRLDPWPPELLHRSWLAIEVEFELLTPWYSKDDRLFHVLDNPVRKDRVFGVPFMAAASLEGDVALGLPDAGRAAGAPRAGQALRGLERSRLDPAPLRKRERRREEFHQGALVFYPTWFDKIGFEVINPHDRSAGPARTRFTTRWCPAAAQETEHCERAARGPPPPLCAVARDERHDAVG